MKLAFVIIAAAAASAAQMSEFYHRREDRTVNYLDRQQTGVVGQQQQGQTTIGQQQQVVPTTVGPPAAVTVPTVVEQCCACPLACSSGFTAAGNKCYSLFIQAAADKTSASIQCRSMGAKLVEPKSVAELVDLATILPSPSTAVWIGMEFSAGSFKYDSDQSIVSSLPWASSYPIDPTIGPCVHYYPDHQGILNSACVPKSDWAPILTACEA